MWIARKLTESRTPQLSAEQGVVTIGGEEAGVLTGSESRGIPLVQPGGFAWRPKDGSGVLILKDAEGKSYLLGTVGAVPRPDIEMADGDVCVYSDRASICLRSGGRIDLSGEVYLNGTLLRTDVSEDGERAIGPVQVN